jgi:hypothetical protein
MMKRIFVLFLAITAITGILLATTSCGGGGSSTTSTSATSTTSSTSSSSKTGTIVGFCQWVDPHAHAGSAMAAGVTINVWDSSDKKVATAVTDSSGGFNIYNVPAGTYTVTGHQDAGTNTDGSAIEEKNWLIKDVKVTASQISSVSMAYQISISELPEKYLK